MKMKMKMNKKKEALFDPLNRKKEGVRTESEREPH